MKRYSDIPLEYDDSSPQSIFDYSSRLLGKSLYEAVTEKIPEIKEYEFEIRGKGGLGQLVEKFYYGYEPNNDPAPDFPKAGVELKTTPLRIAQERYSIKERLVCDMIDFCKIANLSFEESPFYRKCILMLILFYLHKQGVEKHNLMFLYSVLWRIQGKDLQIIKNDYYIIIEKIKQGKAHELSEGDTMYLAACRKGHKEDSLREQPFSGIGAQKRAFSLKTSYMRTILEYIENSGRIMVTNTEYSSPLSELVSSDELKNYSFEQIIINRILKYKGLDYKEIAQKLKISINPAEKSKYDHTTRAILKKGLKRFEDAEEIKKAGIIVKNIRIEKSGRIKESISFKNVDYSEIAENDSFIDSEWYDIVTSRFLFVVYRKVDIPPHQISVWKGETSRYILDKVFFWTMPQSDLPIAESYWENIRENVKSDKHYTESSNTYWRIAEHKKFHIRPKGKDSSDVQFSPISGKQVKKVCYWFNNEYVQEIIKQEYGSEWNITFE